MSASTFFGGLLNWFYSCFGIFSPDTNFLQFILCCLFVLSFLGLIFSLVFVERR